MIEIPSDFDSILPEYPVKVATFEGPLDLLLHLIRKHEVEIYEIPIVLVTKQYLEYLNLLTSSARGSSSTASSSCSSRGTSMRASM